MVMISIDDSYGYDKDSSKDKKLVLSSSPSWRRLSDVKISQN